MPAEETLK